MKYAKVVLALPLKGPFDYSISEGMAVPVLPGMRAWVDFRGKKEIGFIAATAAQTDIPRVKPLISLIDSAPVLSKDLLKLTEEIARYYCCGQGEAVAAALPEAVRKGKPVDPSASAAFGAEEKQAGTVVFQDLDGNSRFDFYARELIACRERNRSAIVLAADKDGLERLKAFLSEKTGLPIEVLLRKELQEVKVWEKIRAQPACVVLGLRSAVFAPVNNLGLIIVDEESASAYKQDQAPHYHAREAARMRCRIENARLLLAASPVSLEAFYYAGLGQEGLVCPGPEAAVAQVSIIDMKALPLLDKRKKIILSRTLQDEIARTIFEKGKVLLFLNRKGFATMARCSTCAKTLQCPRCAINLVYYFSENALRCRYCNYSLVPPKICPLCNSGYIKYSGAGTEKIESELARIFPAARIQRLDAGGVLTPDAGDIFISTQAVLKHPGLRFDLAAAIGIDNGLNRVDFRAAEKTFALLWGLKNLAAKKLFVQTGVPAHPVFEALKAHDPLIFYRAELESRQQLGFPPVRGFIQVRLRGKSEERVHNAAEKLYEMLCAQKPSRATKVLSLNPGEPAKLRGNFYWNIMISTAQIEKANGLIKNTLKQFRFSGIMVAVDVDPL